MGVKQRIWDLSFTGARVMIDGDIITDFMDDANPIEFQDVDTCNIEWSCNGRMIRTAKPSALMVSITVIPGSSSDADLHHIWINSFVGGGTGNLDIVNQRHTLRIRYRSGYGFTLSGGTCVSGPPGAGVNASGKMGGNTYTFAFETIQSSSVSAG